VLTFLQPYCLIHSHVFTHTLTPFVHFCIFAFLLPYLFTTSFILTKAHTHSPQISSEFPLRHIPSLLFHLITRTNFTHTHHRIAYISPPPRTLCYSLRSASQTSHPHSHSRSLIDRRVNHTTLPLSVHSCILTLLLSRMHSYSPPACPTGTVSISRH
jgi:hypothetical protein